MALEKLLIDVNSAGVDQSFSHAVLSEEGHAFWTNTQEQKNTVWRSKHYHFFTFPLYVQDKIAGTKHEGWAE